MSLELSAKEEMPLTMVPALELEGALHWVLAILGHSQWGVEIERFSEFLFSVNLSRCSGRESDDVILAKEV